MQRRQPNLGRELAEANSNDDFVAALPFGTHRSSNKLEKAVCNQMILFGACFSGTPFMLFEYLASIEGLEFFLHLYFPLRVTIKACVWSMLRG